MTNFNTPRFGMERADIVRQTDRETVFNGAGNSHFSHVQGSGFHVTTQVPGFGAKEGLDRGLSIHDPIRDMRF